MARVLIVGSAQIERELPGSVLLGPHIQTLFAADGSRALPMALAEPPNLVLVDAVDREAAAGFMRRLRTNPQTRRCSMVALSRSSSLDDERALLAAGANLVLSPPVDASRWNPRLEQLLAVPLRRAARIPVRFEFWSGEAAGAEPMNGIALNLSVHGLLVETEVTLDLGSRLDLAFELPDRHGELRALGCVARDAGGNGWSRSGIEFLILHGDARTRIGAFVHAQLPAGA